MTIIINLIGIGLIGLVVWWFWLYKPSNDMAKAKNTNEGDVIEIVVQDGVYTPSQIQAEINQPIILRFIRKDASPCSEMVNFSSLNISRQLALDKPTDIQIELESPGEYEFTCQMGMYRGKLIAK